MVCLSQPIFNLDNLKAKTIFNCYSTSHWSRNLIAPFLLFFLKNKIKIHCPSTWKIKITRQSTWVHTVLILSAWMACPWKRGGKCCSNEDTLTQLFLNDMWMLQAGMPLLNGICCKKKKKQPYTQENPQCWPMGNYHTLCHHPLRFISFRVTYYWLLVWLYGRDYWHRLCLPLRLLIW